MSYAAYRREQFRKSFWRDCRAALKRFLADFYAWYEIDVDFDAGIQKGQGR